MKYTQEQINEYRAMWLAQLRDPESKMWIGELENIDDRNKRCCLGHACHALQATRIEDFESNEVKYIFEHDWETSYLPFGIAEKLNIKSNGLFREKVEFWGFEYEDLGVLNDSGVVKTPADMAVVIEEQFKNDNFIEYNE